MDKLILFRKSKQEDSKFWMSPDFVKRTESNSQIEESQ